jgi:transposase
VQLSESSSVPDRIRRRARVVLRAAAGSTNQRIAAVIGTDPGTVARWRRRFLLHGTSGILKDAPRPGRPAVIPDAIVEAVLRETLGRGALPPRRWSTRSLARQTGVSRSTIQRIWRARGLNPGRAAPPAPSPEGTSFLRNVTDMVGVYLDPPDRAIAFAADERTLPVAPPAGEKPPESRAQRRRQGAEFRAFLQVVDRQTPPGLDVHLLLDSRFAPSGPSLQRWLDQRPRIHVHLLPASREGLSLIDRLVVDFSRRRTRSAESPSAQRLRLALRQHLRLGGGLAEPFVWTTVAEDPRERRHRAALHY